MPEKKSVFLIEPAIESLFALSEDSPWSAKILKDPDITMQVYARLKLLVRFHFIFVSVPNAATDIVEAIEKKWVKPKELAEVYETLVDFLDSSHYHRRLVLYFPFELLPPKAWEHDRDGLQNASDRFAAVYMRRWRELLDEVDVRANFFDGNILEKELAQGGQPRVIKAAHLIPQLLKKGLITIDEVKTLRDAATNDILKSSLDDALMSPEEVAEEKMEPWGSAQLFNLTEEIENELRKLDMRAATDHSRNLPPARIEWERKDHEDKLITKYARYIARLLNARLPVAYVRDYLSPTYSRTVRLCAMRGIGLAAEQIFKRPEASPWARTLSDGLIDFLKDIRDEPVEIVDELEEILVRSTHLGITTEDDLRIFGLQLPKLDAEFSKTGPHAELIGGYTEAIEKIEQNAEYARLLYPIAIFFGSRLKGYAKRNADLDAAVFVRPGVSRRERWKIRRILTRLFGDRIVGGKVVEFWLEEKEGELHIRDFPDPDVFLADSTWVHLLMQSVWLGNEAALKELYSRLLSGFLHVKDRKFEVLDMRKLCLDEMERDVLQYRLMHKGYRRFYPKIGGIDASLANLDPHSVFWDSGYRRLATKLYLSRVFLPQVGTKDD